MALRRCIARMDDGSPCRALTARTRCDDHARAHDAPRRAVYDDRRYRRLRDRVIRQWRAERGPWCPGWGVPGHAASELTLDHVVPLDAGGDAYDERNAGVLCRACNARKQAHV